MDWGPQWFHFLLLTYLTLGPDEFSKERFLKERPTPNHKKKYLVKLSLAHCHQISMDHVVST